MNKFIILIFTALILSGCAFGASPATPATVPASGSGTSQTEAANVPPSNTPVPTAVSAEAATHAALSPGTGATATTVTTVAGSEAATAAAAQGQSNCIQGTGSVVTLASELKWQDLLICDGAEARAGMTVAINFVGSLRDGGAQFDSSYDRGQPYTFVLGSGPMQGWDEGIVGMKVGSKRRLTIPPSLAYGSQPHAGNHGVNVPPNSTLVYDVELVSAK